MTTSSTLPSSSSPPAPVKIVFERRVRPGAEAAFKAWSERFVDAVSRFPGHEGASVLSMPHGESQFVLVRFATAADLERWQQSSEFGALIHEADALGPAGEYSEIKTGMETWFTLPDKPAPAKAAPRWEMAVITWAALFPMVIVLGYLLGPLGLPPLIQQATGTIIPVVMLTWVITPRLTRVLYHWLYPASQGPAH
jgi:antibiotic biosynthesis monooxygenase (ABM) superfamily enzyme